MNYPYIPNGVWIGGALDGEVDDAAQHAGMAGSIAGPQRRHLHAVARRRNAPLQRKENAVHRRQQYGDYGQQRRNATPHVFLLLRVVLGFVWVLLVGIASDSEH